MLAKLTNKDGWVKYVEIPKPPPPIYRVAEIFPTTAHVSFGKDICVCRSSQVIRNFRIAQDYYESELIVRYEEG